MKKDGFKIKRGRIMPIGNMYKEKEPTLGIQKYANLSRLLLPEDIEKFKEKTLF